MFYAVLMYIAWYLNPYFNKGFSIEKAFPQLVAPPYGKDVAATMFLFTLIGAAGIVVGEAFVVVMAGALYYYKKRRGTVIPPIKRREGTRRS